MGDLDGIAVHEKNTGNAVQIWAGGHIDLRGRTLFRGSEPVRPFFDLLAHRSRGGVRDVGQNAAGVDGIRSQTCSPKAVRELEREQGIGEL